MIESTAAPVISKHDIVSHPEELVDRMLSVDGATMLVDKPFGVTSFVVVYSLRKLLSRASGEKWIKVGHSGTLDPLATGLVIIGTRRSTRLLTHFLGLSKEYEVELRLGVTSPSFDLERQITVTHDLRGIYPAAVIEAVEQFVGKQLQTPPIFSAVKQHGKPVYRRAHKGKPVEMVAKEIEIYSIDHIAVGLPFVRFTVCCSKGTYIRSIANDLGDRLGPGAVLTALRRTKIGEYSVEDAIAQSELHSLFTVGQPV